MALLAFVRGRELGEEVCKSKGTLVSWLPEKSSKILGESKADLSLVLVGSWK